MPSHGLKFKIMRVTKMKMAGVKIRGCKKDCAEKICASFLNQIGEATPAMKGMKPR